MDFLDKHAPIDVTHGSYLPHWEQDGNYQFVTFRLADSLPQDRIRELKAMSDNFLKQHPKPWNRDTEISYWRIIGPIEQRLLDAGMGSCLLRSPDVRAVVSDALRHYDEVRYVVMAYVIMPNHVHLLVKGVDGYSVKETMKSVKGFTGKVINRICQKQGVLWAESYDRQIRNEDHLKYTINYILRNPRFLRSDEYEIYLKDWGR